MYDSFINITYMEIYNYKMTYDQWRRIIMIKYVLSIVYQIYYMNILKVSLNNYNKLIRWHRK